jgi:hypothetical protein
MHFPLTISGLKRRAVARTARAFATGLVCCALVAGCELFEEPGTVAIVNNSSHQVIVTAGAETQVAFQGKALEMPYPDPDALSGGHIHVETTLCRMDFQVPLNSDDYPWKARANGELTLQLETDFKLYAIPPATRLPVQFTAITRLQRGAFPVWPTNLHCGRSDEDQ